ncbi:MULTISPECIES: hypothetical protein [unclassified Paenibacillus]|jgi:hypothetical protein|uniref:hypothetical protein n=1 Tax=unclassified Paenibacillus TaxID=185978 RepID=UPI0027D7FDA9|nr:MULTISPECIES: hypothetical protein [unclassified Paenibacillus]
MGVGVGVISGADVDGGSDGFGVFKATFDDKQADNESTKNSIIKIRLCFFTMFSPFSQNHSILIVIFNW